MPTVTIGRRTGDTFTGLEDTSISQVLPNAVGGTADRVYVSCVSVGSSKRAIFRFTGLSNIPANAIVSAASLTLTRLNNASPTRNYVVKKLLVAPNEAQATWNNRATATAWQTGGASGASDVDATVVASGAISTSGGATTVITGAAFIALVQGWIDGSTTNNGILMQVENDGTASGGDFDFATGERTTSAQRPYLTVTYTTPIPPDITVDDIAVNNLSGTATFTISLSSSFALPVTVYRETTDDTATSPDDYTTLPIALVTFAPGETEKTVDVSLIP